MFSGKFIIENVQISSTRIVAGDDRFGPLTHWSIYACIMSALS